MPHSARLHGGGLFLRRVAAALALVGASALPTSADTASAATASPTASFAAITCPTTTTCFTAGTYGDAQHAYFQPLVGRLAGGKWNLTRAPAPAVASGQSGRGELNGIACPTPKRCFAVGGYDIGYPQSVNRRPLIEQWDGRRWTLASRLRPAGSNSSTLADIDCPSVTRCLAVGYWHEVDARTQVLLMQWDGKTWSILHSPHPPPKAMNNKLVSISCGSASSCFGVGTYQLSHHPGQTLTERWNGTRWAVVSSPNPPKPFNYYDELTGVACASATSCLATGAQYDSLYEGSYKTLSLRWTGTRWLIVSTPAPPTYLSYVLSGVACPASNACFSAGTTNTYNPDSGRLTRDAHIERWDGTRWSTAKTALDSGPPLYAIECDTPSRCIAAGASSSTPVIAHWNGSAWSAATVPVAFGPG